MTARVGPEERGAAFHAVGYGRATGRPAVLVCTSGTALANYLPAVVEAAQDQVPLLVLSADRPPELQDTGANQTIVQRGIFGGYTRWSAELPVPVPRIDPRVVLTTVDQAVFRASSVPAGPVHLNCPFPEPLEPEPLPQPLVAGDRWRTGAEPFTIYSAPAAEPRGGEAVAALLRLVAGSQRGLLVAGGLPRGCAAAVEALAARCAWPLLGDVTSGARGTPGLQLLLQSAAGRELLRPDLRAPVRLPRRSQAVPGVDRRRGPAVGAGGGRSRPPRPQPLDGTTRRGRPRQVAHQLGARCPPRPATAYATAVQAAGARARAAVAAWSGARRGLDEPTVARLVAAAAGGPPACGLFGASSMPIRDLDTFATPLPAGGSDSRQPRRQRQ